VYDARIEPGFTGPNEARIYDYLLGGKDAYAPERAAGDQLMAMFPGVEARVRQHREFARRAARWLHDEGVGQFLDVGCGYPSRPSTAEAVPCARVAYVDSDPVVLVHLKALAAGDGIAVVAGDAGEHAAVLASPELAGVINLAEPVGVLLCGILSAMDPEAARSAVRGYADALAPGSAIAVSCVSYRDQEAGDAAAAAYRAVAGGTYYSHSRTVIAGFFAAAGLRLVQGGVGDVRAWWGPAPTCERGIAVLGGVGVKTLPSRRSKRPAGPGWRPAS
jgi:O-methyltransferase involved in polyketide biosynthesis